MKLLTPALEAQLRANLVARFDALALAELEAVRLPFGLTIERDLHFTASHPLSTYAEAARRAGSIVLGEPRLRRAADRLSGRG